LIRVAVVGTGAMGRGIIHVLRKTADIQVVAVADSDPAALERVKPFLPIDTLITTDSVNVLAKKPEVLVEATPSILDAALLVEKALGEKTHVVLMNSEVDQTFGRLLAKRAQSNGVILTSDAGDQHGVLMRMIDEVRQIGFEIVMAVNNKGFLDRYATPESLKEEAAKRRLSLNQCTAYTDGTKLAIEMALVANAAELNLLRIGMVGPALNSLTEAFDAFDLEVARKRGGVVDYVLGAKPGGSVFIIAYSNDEDDRFYMDYYKMGEGPYYQFIRPYHICHYETLFTIRRIVETGKPVLVQRRRTLEVGCRAKVDLRKGTRLEGIGGHHLYGFLETPINLPIGLAEGTVLRRDKKKDENIGWDDVRFQDDDIRLDLWQEQGD
jgi:predicted homoserine dehydrogenase-like protein